MSRRKENRGEGRGGGGVGGGGGGGRESSHHLLGGHDDGLDAELAAAHVEEILERRSKEVDDEDVVEALVAKVIDLGDAG